MRRGSAAPSLVNAFRWDLGPLRTTVYRLVEVVVRIAGSQKVKRGVDHAQSIARTSQDTMYRRPGLAGIGALKRPIVLSNVKRGRMSRAIDGYVINAVVYWYNCVQVLPLLVERDNPQVSAAVSDVHGCQRFPRVWIDSNGPYVRPCKVSSQPVPGCPTIGRAVEADTIRPHSRLCPCLRRRCWRR